MKRFIMLNFEFTKREVHDSNQIWWVRQTVINESFNVFINLLKTYKKHFNNKLTNKLIRLRIQNEYNDTFAKRCCDIYLKEKIELLLVLPKRFHKYVPLYLDACSERIRIGGPEQIDFLFKNYNTPKEINRAISKLKYLDPGIMRKYADRLDWHLICQIQYLPRDIIYRFRNRIHWHALKRNPLTWRNGFDWTDFVKIRAMAWKERPKKLRKKHGIRPLNSNPGL